TSTDYDSSILQLNFSTLNVFSSVGGHIAFYSYHTPRNLHSFPTRRSSDLITSYNNSTLTNTNTFTVTPDTTNPSGGALTVNSTKIGSAHIGTPVTSPTRTPTAASNNTDAGSGLASSTLTRQTATLSSSDGI